MTLMGLSPVYTVTPLGKMIVVFVWIAGTFMISLLIAATDMRYPLKYISERSPSRLNDGN